MAKQTIEIDSLKCLCCDNPKSDNITYVLYPVNSLGEWIEDASVRYKTTIVVITSIDWDNDLTPWPAKGVPKGSPDFGGKAQDFLERLKSLAITLENKMSLPSGLHRRLVGVSLSGLFTLWQWVQTSFFHDIACLSGSFWYEGFADWFDNQNLSGKSGFAYFLLGNKEPYSNVAEFRTVGNATQLVVDHLKSYGILTEFDMVNGNHYQYPIERMNLAMKALYGR